MKLILTLTLYTLTLQAESQSFFNQNNEQYTGRSRAVYPTVKQQNLYANSSANVNKIGPSQSYQFGPNSQTENVQVPEFDSYLQAISRNENTPNRPPNRSDAGNDDGRIHFVEPSIDLIPPPFGANASPNNYYSTQRSYNVIPDSTSVQGNINYDNIQKVTAAASEPSILNNVTLAISNFGLNLIKAASQYQTGNVIVSPTSIATVLALLQQGATGATQEQITRSLQMTPAVSETAFGTIAANMRKRNSRNILSIANNILVADTFELNNAFKTLAVRSFWSEVTPMNFANPLVAILKINAWVAAKTNDKITNLLQPGSVSPSTQLVLVNAVYFKGIWNTKFKPEKTQSELFHLSNGDKKNVPFMHSRHTFQVGLDPNNHALVLSLPFESHQYSLMLILPSKNDNAANLLSMLTAEHLLYYQTFGENEIKVEIPRFSLKTDTDLNPVLKNMGLTNIFGTKSDLSGIGLYRTSAPQISSAVHSGFLSIDEQGVTASAATAFAAVALSYDDSSTTFRADRPFLAVLWDKQYSIPLFIAKIEDPS